jgi:rubrerythrin
MKTKILTIVITLCISGVAACSHDKTKSNNNQSTVAETVMKKDSVYYTCSMHTEVKLNNPGKCPKCGMTLVKKTMKITETKSKNMEAMKTYTCSMHPEVKADKPGKCPICGMVLIEKK